MYVPKALDFAARQGLHPVYAIYEPGFVRVVAALARYNPFAVVLIAFLLGGLQNAGFALQGADFPNGLVGVLQGLILFCALGGELFVRYRLRIDRRAATAPEPAS